ncbi:hypothetical protein RHGRI_038838 [Rhododendron griersonianum]|uniref:Uncharacterized protein n=1 Tax=Rhododendron griersonianum TaxID=479676 RepID=A0AAV6HII9_9ERIC|nr:hypothetical protein RHGRI_038838 [Rhododendron griersonianum]
MSNTNSPLMEVVQGATASSSRQTRRETGNSSRRTYAYWSEEDVKQLIIAVREHGVRRKRYSPTPIAVLDPPSLNLGSFVECDHDSAPSPPDTSIDKNLTDSRALVVVPAMNVGASAVVPARKSKRSEAAQRRIRRPFSVSEVEALVQAVEKPGTGRISGKHWCTRREYRPSKGGVSRCPKSSWTGSSMPMLIGPNNKPSQRLAASFFENFNMNESSQHLLKKQFCFINSCKYYDNVKSNGDKVYVIFL